ncbi:MAG TPA: di-heme oxidoredictase family protein [Steroidobacteraceae bacterium]|nr:di-heme oxidoredictase family protein [Steroidobacteraceae bacterium]
MPRPAPRHLAAALCALLPATLAAVGTGGFTGRVALPDRRDPPPRRALAPQQQAAFDLGLLVFNTSWVAAGTPRAGRRDGLGPLYVAASCDTCHNNGARGRPPENGGLSNSFVMQLDGPPGMPYGAVLNTAALPDHSREGQVEVNWTLRHGHYDDGTGWTLREPHYALTHLLYGPPPAATILRPRIAPQIYGVGLLEAVPADAPRAIREQQPRAVRGELPAGRFGWRGEVRDVEDQTGRAFAREMGLTSRPRMQDDCTATQVACRAAPNGGTPEVSDEFLQAVLTFQRELPVPARTVLPADTEAAGRRLFEQTGCAACHVLELPVAIDGAKARIDAGTDLLVHDLGEALADHRADGTGVPVRWRTAPLWGLAQALQFGDIALLHDGRAASVEQAILWHGGQAAGAQRAFQRLSATERAQLLRWVGSL